MSKVTLAVGINFGAPTFDYQQDTPNLQPAIDAKSNSLVVWPQGFSGAVLFHEPNFGGQSLVITNPGSVMDLSKSKWGNLANWIRSVRTGAHGFDVNGFINDVLSGKHREDVIIVAKLPDAVPDSY